MAIKKSQIYSTLWSACDKLRGAMDASQYKDYVLIMLFVKYLSDRESASQTQFRIPEGCRFKDFVELKGSSSIGESINKKLEALKEENLMMLGKITLPDFNDPAKFGKSAEKTNTLSNLIAAFETGDLDFSKNRSADDDILGDAYEYLMKNFAVQSGKSKGQFYTPAEVSRVMAKLLHLGDFPARSTTIYDPTCGSGSLLLRAVDETPNGATPFGQEKDIATSSLAILNMLLHDKEMATIEQGDTLLSPKFLAEGRLETFDVCVANPPFSVKSWMGENGSYDPYNRWNDRLCPPQKCGDYAFLLHLIASMKPGTGRGACILPHGVLFRGNAEYEIRKNIVDRHYIEGIVGLPPNIFFGTGIPASIIILNKADADKRNGIFFIDAKDGYMKEGAKNRLREQDVKLIIDTWDARKDVEHYARFVPNEEIIRNDYNLNIPRYVTPPDTEIRQDIDAHLHGGLPQHDIDKLNPYFEVCPSLKRTLFESIDGRTGYYNLKVEKKCIADAVQNDPDMMAYRRRFIDVIDEWCGWACGKMMALDKGIKPKRVIEEWSQSLLDRVFEDEGLVNGYDVYQKLMEYWADVLQDDCYIISRDAWTLPPLYGTKKNPSYKDLVCDLLPVPVVVNEFFSREDDRVNALQDKYDEISAAMKEMLDRAVEEYKEANGYCDESDETDEDDEEEKEKREQEEKQIRKTVTAQLKKTEKYKALDKEKRAVAGQLKEALEALTQAVRAKYDSLRDDEIRCLVVNKKWLADIAGSVEQVMNTVQQQFVSEVVSLAERYETTLTELSASVEELGSRVNAHLKDMGFEL